MSDYRSDLREQEQECAAPPATLRGLMRHSRLRPLEPSRGRRYTGNSGCKALVAPTWREIVR
jgi:hypothetical protein